MIDVYDLRDGEQVPSPNAALRNEIMYRHPPQSYHTRGLFTGSGISDERANAFIAEAIEWGPVTITIDNYGCCAYIPN